MCNRPSCATEAGSALTLTSLGFTYLSFVTSYALVIGSLYNIAYWSTFGINAFQYAGLTEQATSAFQFMLRIAGATDVGAWGIQPTDPALSATRRRILVVNRNARLTGYISIVLDGTFRYDACGVHPVVWCG